MKKLISFLLTVTMLLTCTFVCALPAQAATRKNVPQYKVGDKFTIHLSVTKKRTMSTDWDHAYYAKFKPEKDGDYEFSTSGLEFYDFICYKALIVDAKDNVVSYAYALGEDSFSIDVVGHLKGGRTYYYLVEYYNDNYENHSIDLKISIKKHKHQMINTENGSPDAEHMYDAVDENGKYIDMCKVQGCTDSGIGVYYNHYSVEPAKKRMTYTGKARKPKLRFFDMRGKEFTPDFKYKCKYKNNVKVGTAKIDYCVDGLWNSTKFKIVPAATEITKATPTRRGFKLKWKKQTVQTGGFQVQYSKNKSFKKSTKVFVKGKDSTSYRAKGLKGKCKYFVRVRAYKTVDGKKYYSKWSETKTIKTK